MTMLVLTRDELTALVRLVRVGRQTVAAQLPPGQRVPVLDEIIARLDHELAAPDLDDLLDDLLAQLPSAEDQAALFRDLGW